MLIAFRCSSSSLFSHLNCSCNKNKVNQNQNSPQVAYCVHSGLFVSTPCVLL